MMRNRRGGQKMLFLTFKQKHQLHANCDLKAHKMLMYILKMQNNGYHKKSC